MPTLYGADPSMGGKPTTTNYVDEFRKIEGKNISQPKTETMEVKREFQKTAYDDFKEARNVRYESEIARMQSMRKTEGLWKNAADIIDGIFLKKAQG